MGVNSHQMSIVWCLTRKKGMKNLEDRSKWAIESLLMKWAKERMNRMDDEMGDQIDDRMD